jgi:hypothetical protein
MYRPGFVSFTNCANCGARHIAQRACSKCVKTDAPRIDYRIVRHAAHTVRSQGWDLEIWDVCQPFDAPYPLGVPLDAEKHSGSFVRGVAWTRFVRKAPMSEGTCEYCRPRATISEAL